MKAELSGGMRELLDRFRSGRRAALARAISVVEDEAEDVQAFLHALLARGPVAARIGLTGPPGAGKSSLLAGLATAYRARGEDVGVVAVDPTSPYSGGALLGDRIRMNDLATDPGIFIRSMATRGSLGGLATTSREVIDLMDAFGFPRVMVETVGVGQTELEITAATDTVVVVLVPESGDAIQAMKAGLMEIADVFVVNKADRPGADRLLREIRQSLHLRAGETMPGVPAHHGVDFAAAARRARPGRGGGREAGPGVPEPGAGSGPEGAPSAGSGSAGSPGAPAAWRIPVLATVAQSGDGIPGLLDAIEAHRTYLVGSGELERRRRERAERRIRDVVERELRRAAWGDPGVERRVVEGLEAIDAGSATPYSVAADILEGLLGDRR